MGYYSLSWSGKFNIMKISIFPTQKTKTNQKKPQKNKKGKLTTIVHFDLRIFAVWNITSSAVGIEMKAGALGKWDGPWYAWWYLLCNLLFQIGAVVKFLPSKLDLLYLGQEAPKLLILDRCYISASPRWERFLTI